MDQIQIIELKKTLLENNDADADLLRKELLDERTFYLNVMSSPGSGKTSSILRLIEQLRERLRIGVLEDHIVRRRTHGKPHASAHDGQAHDERHRIRRGGRHERQEQQAHDGNAQPRHEHGFRP